ncbi:molybdopterin-containing oxidoreductase family protein [Clostridium estertheticum]|uniref:Molybdopterin-dependent oxidoreductase n=1 Tax=Clostridium estertheticum TaxID=238834 RepID=A0AA47I564_9CLOT|nr:molybdopterin-dependent oxidoreductase [Clostridium estertheticum]MBU3156542.1 molybdopterin-dependent oxidoreductase [Clostridium estertheticum]WAG59303.1 molybdopterin-dependent oxidoreductase [Clostridium estertheticum]
MGEWKRTNCNMCVQACGLEVQTENNMIVNVRPDPKSPRSQNYCCRKGRSIKNYQHHTDRLNYPLKRVGNEFVKISWEQALKEIGEKLNQTLNEYGPRAIGTVGCSLPAAQANYAMAETFRKLVGTQNQFTAIGAEFMGPWWSYGKILGGQFNFADPDEARNEVLILWGTNTYVTHQIARARTIVREFSEDPEKMLILVDPRLSETARMADMHVAPRLGSDALLIRAMIALILREGWQHQDYLDEHALDFDKIKPWFTNVDIEESCRICQIPYEEVKKLCRILTTRKWGLHMDLGISMGRHNTLSPYLLIVMMSVCGVLCVPGGCVVQEIMFDQGLGTDDHDQTVWRTLESNYAPVKGSFPVGCLPEEILSDNPKHLRSLVVAMSNPIRSYPDTNLMEKALNNLDLLVVMETCMSETARIADYILPETTAYEGYDFCAFQYSWPKTICHLKHPVLKPEGERLEGGEIWMRMADAMGLIPKIPESLYNAAKDAVATGDRIKYLKKLMLFVVRKKLSADVLPMIIAKTLGKAMGSVACSLTWAATITSPLAGTGQIERASHKPKNTHRIMQVIPKLKDICLLDAVFQEIMDHPEGIVFGIADNENFHRIAHSDGKIHLFNEDINEYIKRITPEKEDMALTTKVEFPLVLSSGRHTDAGVNNVMRNPRTNKYRNPCVIAMNPEDGAELGIKDGQKVRITTQSGSVEIETEFTYQTCKGYILVPHHFGLEFNGKKYGISANTLLPAKHMDEMTGDPIARYVPCRVEAILGGSES